MRKSICIVLSILLLSSCGVLKRWCPKYTPQKDTLIINNTVIEHTRDSIFLQKDTNTEQRGDTTIIKIVEKHYIERWHAAEKIHDTLRIQIPPEPVEPEIIEVEKKLTKLQKTLIGLGISFIITIILVLVFFGIKIYIKLKVPKL